MRKTKMTPFTMDFFCISARCALREACIGPANTTGGLPEGGTLPQK